MCPERPFGQQLARVEMSGGPHHHRAAHSLSETRPDLASVVEAWDGLSEAVRAGILAMVGASRG